MTDKDSIENKTLYKEKSSPKSGWAVLIEITKGQAKMGECG